MVNAILVTSFQECEHFNFSLISVIMDWITKLLSQSTILISFIFRNVIRLANWSKKLSLLQL